MRELLSQLKGQGILEHLVSQASKDFYDFHINVFYQGLRPYNQFTFSRQYREIAIDNEDYGNLYDDCQDK